VLIVHALGYYRRYQTEMLSRSRLQSQLSQAQLQALKMQLHPHFLFNTLHSISALLNQDREAARSMIARLGDFLRLTLENSGTQEVSLEKEMDFLKCYLEIERIRFQDRLTTLLDVEPSALDVQVPNLILQPIVENAIRHGIAPRSTPGQIEIQAKHLDNMLRIRVRDNGPGLSPNQNGHRKNGKGLGLANTRARLEQLYGDAHHFELVNAPDGGLIVTLDIPLASAAAAATAQPRA
jgi:LytS/YehU family sensor histidine kinase